MPDFDLPKGFIRLNYSLHALREAKNDKYGYHGLPDFLDVSLAEVIEVETSSNGKPKKVLYRTSYTEKFDLCLVVLIDECFVKTVWLNEQGDTHENLNRAKYVQKPK
jgi:hypothetical protein